MKTLLLLDIIVLIGIFTTSLVLSIAICKLLKLCRNADSEEKTTESKLEGGSHD